MADEYENLAYRWFEEVWNKQREDAIDEMFHEDGLAHGLSGEDGGPLRGPEGFKALHRAFLETFPDLKVTVEETVCEGENIAARCTVTGTHLGEGLGVSPTETGIEFTGLAIIKVRDGKIIEAWNNFDFMSMYQQLGVLNLNLQ